MNELLALARCYATPSGIILGRREDVADGAARAFVLRIGDQRFHGFAVRQGEAVSGYVDRCPHAGLPLAQVLDGYLTQDARLIQCSWHGALFAIDDGKCVGGPCAGQGLTPWPLSLRDGMIVTGGAKAG